MVVVVGKKTNKLLAKCRSCDIVPLYWNARCESFARPSFNPLDVARMFDAPLLRETHDEDIEGFVRKREGLRRVRYGARDLDEGEGIKTVKMAYEDNQDA
jgi:hypothetical protein